MHNGLFPELANVVMTYNAGMVKKFRKEIRSMILNFLSNPE
ncbi:hypothetical protein OWR28_01270 [Chryseobacterium sp. 1B4]